MRPKKAARDVPQPKSLQRFRGLQFTASSGNTGTIHIFGSNGLLITWTQKDNGMDADEFDVWFKKLLKESQTA